jgi:hypothetical protein
MKNLSTFIHGFDFVHAKPASSWASGLPKQVYQASLIVEEQDYATYFADAQERTETGAGEPISATISLKLPNGMFLARFYSPVNGEYSPGVRIEGGHEIKLNVPAFEQDLVLRVTREK